MGDFVTRSGRNVDIVFASIAATLVSPPLAVLAALLSSLYAASKPREKIYKIEQLKDILYNAIIEHNHRITMKLIEYEIKKSEADRLVHKVAYESYIDKLVAKYA